MRRLRHGLPHSNRKQKLIIRKKARQEKRFIAALYRLTGIKL